MFDQNTYDEDVELFNKISAAEAKQLLSADSLTVIYIGRGTCPYCRKFARKLAGLADQINTTINYVDSSNTSDDDISSFREQYDIVTVPGFVVGKDGKVTVRCDSSTPEAEILAMTK